MLAHKTRVCERETGKGGTRGRESYGFLISLSLSHGLSSLFLPSTYIWGRGRKRGAEHKESARKVYNALKPARRLLLYIKPVNSWVNMPTVPLHAATLSLIAQDRKWQRETDTCVYRQAVSSSASHSLDCCHPLCVTHIDAHTPTRFTPTAVTLLPSTEIKIFVNMNC